MKILGIDPGTAAIGFGLLWFRSRGRAPAERPYLIVVGLDARRSTVAELPQQENPQNADARFIRLASLAEQFWAKPADLPITLAPMDSGGRGYALFDPAGNQGFIAIQQLPAAAAGKRYHLWLLDTATGKIREAGVIPLSSSDHGLYFFTLPPGGGEQSGRPGFFVTVEDNAAPSAHQPQGKVVLGNDRI